VAQEAPTKLDTIVHLGRKVKANHINIDKRMKHVLSQRFCRMRGTRYTEHVLHISMTSMEFFFKPRLSLRFCRSLMMSFRAVF
jgi:hypothetical protein